MTCLIQVACSTTWPDEGQGGMAEYTPRNYRTVTADEPLGPEHGLRFDLELTARHLDILILEGAELCFPATVKQSKIREVRIRRQLDGNLDGAAANDILIQRELLARLERQLDYVKQHDICELPVAQTNEKVPGEMAARIAELLNADNQFAHDSAELNPKYIGRLAEAAQLLKEADQFKLRIIGFADDTGSNSYNQGLSQKRANKVARYLSILGVASNRMTVTAVGESDLPYPGTAPEIRLVNRSVRIEVLDMTAQIGLAKDKAKQASQHDLTVIKQLK
ncbi:OmpA family protein [Catenovulum sp. SM1970]|nr:OmpA family protein [Marinifaba aquimaris]